MWVKIFHGSLARRVFLRALAIATALSIFPLLQTIYGDDSGLFTSVSKDDCGVNFAIAPLLISNTNSFSSRFLKPIWGSVESVQCKENVNLTTAVVRELMGMRMLAYDSKTLCIGRGSASAILALRDLGFSYVCGVHRHPFLSLKKLVYELDYQDDAFDFVFSRDLDEVSVPALLVLEIERILKPGGVGAMLVGSAALNSNSLIRSATPVSSLLKSSNIVYVGYVEEFTLVVFRKKVENFEQNQVLPADCQSVANNKPYMDYIEPLAEKKPADFEKSIAYLPKFVNVFSKKRLVYVDIGAAEHLNTSVTSWFMPSYPVDSKAFNVYFVDHNTSVMLSYVRKPGITFVYHPDLAGSKPSASPPTFEDLDPLLEDESFDFLGWFEETVQYADFVVLKMNANEVELKFLSELFKSGNICFVDELFLHCSGRSDCMDIFKKLRSSGVYVHQWWRD